MFPFAAKPDWYENYWLSDQPRPRQRSLAGHLARFAVVVALVVGGGAVLSHYHGHNDGGYQDWEQE
ncbi:MAG TPA: hypothetical protein VFL55_22300 [Acetobacteraceae bacterium]|jgi:hypothetical protein|nr:hypothetical protein [Acetobacteraceae bacterium]